MTNRPDSIEDMLPLLEDMEQAWHKQWDQLTKGIPYGTRRMTDEQHVAWFAEMQRRFPPEPMVTPDGQVVVLSPWLAALAYCEDGRKELQRYRDTMMEHTMGAMMHG